MENVAWHRGGFNIQYDSNGSTIRTSSKPVKFITNDLNINSQTTILTKGTVTTQATNINNLAQ